jgi:hypothetical protein
MDTELAFILRRFEDRNAILFNQKTGEITWPIINLPEDVNPNDEVKLRLITKAMELDEEVQALKRTLEELVN